MANLGYIQVTRLCNQKCRICSNPESPATISIDEGRRIIDDFIERGYDGIILTGGEPTLYEHLRDLISYAVEKGIHARLITNGQKIHDIVFLKSLIDAGLGHIHVSIQSVREETQAFLTRNGDSLKNILGSLENIGKTGINADINTPISHYNAEHLDENVIFLTDRFPFLRHFVWNNLDPTMNRATENPDVIPKLREFEISLMKAMRFLDKTGRTFRVERVPLCYMAEYAHCSTETRKIVKGEERIVHFLDSKGMVHQTAFNHGKTDCCDACSVNSICAGLYEMDRYYSSQELYPLFISSEKIAEKVLDDSDNRFFNSRQQCV
ncbi:MAG: radical SAM protein [Deltaproteobacteria bacterium]|nr:radical SAM protein [Deltaproteobacteria bacterium]